ncbi:translation initiation factor IF-2 subunit gamma, partial [Candidatus Woesearchaeota archaeon]|nr:translation initiation factor IF-2 subunit gamma [Candidatus Woesearchaeota archaeon]
ALEAKKIKNIIVAQNKIDLVTKEQALKNYQEIKEFLKGTDYENSPIIPISAQQEINLDKIMEEICKLEITKKDENSNPIFLIARSFDVNKPGSLINDIHGGILGGILKQGKLKVGDEIEIKPGITIKKGNQQNYQTIYTKIVSIHKGKINVKEVKPGASISLETELDPHLTKADFLSGCICGLKNKLPEITYRIKMNYELFKEVLGIQEHKEVSPIKIKEMLMLSVQTTITVGIVEKIKGKTMELSLNVPIISLEGENVGIARNINNHWRLIGWGNLTNNG